MNPILLHAERVGLVGGVVEHCFAPPRRWRFDYAWPGLLLALEVEGGVWSGGRHTRGSGFLRDMEKYNTASLLGWRVFRTTPQQIESGATFALLERMAEQFGEAQG